MNERQMLAILTTLVYSQSSPARGLWGLPQTRQFLEAEPIRVWNQLQPHEQSVAVSRPRRP
jgi:hypothetical protein